MANLTYKICSEADTPALIDLLWSMKDELFLPDRNAAAEIIELLFQNGGTFATYDNNRMIGLLGYFLGEPADDFANKDVAFIYVAGLAREYRMSRAFQHGLAFALKKLSEFGLSEARFHAAESDPFTNRLYARFASPVRKEKNRRGHSCILYSRLLQQPTIVPAVPHATAPEVEQPARKQAA